MDFHETKIRLERIEGKIDLIQDKMGFLKVLDERTKNHRFLIGTILAGLLGLALKVIL